MSSSGNEVYEEGESSPARPLSLVKISGKKFPFKRCGSLILFRREPLETFIFGEEASGIPRIFRGRKMLYFQKAWNRSYVSWNLLKIVLECGILEYALRDCLNRYKPFQEGPAGSIPEKYVLERDTLKINGLHIPFKVLQNGSVYLDVLGAFTLLGKLKIAMSNNWKDVDRILEKNSISHKDAFRRKDKSSRVSKKWYSHRSHITVTALRCLAQEYVLNVDRREALTKLLYHLQKEMDIVIQKKNNIYNDFRTAINEIQAANTEVEGFKLDQKSEKEGNHIGTESCDSTCGRKYHFILKCCNASHSLIIAEKVIGYIVKDDQIFLDKCNAFAALGRMYVVRCSDYRKSDKILESSGMNIQNHYLYERRNYSSCNPRNRRTHISLEAFVTLVHMGFADSIKNEFLLESIRRVVADVYILKEKCDNYFKMLEISNEAEKSEDEIKSSDELVSELSVKCNESPTTITQVVEKPIPNEELGEEAREKTVTSSEKDSSHFSVYVMGKEIKSKVEKGNLYLELISVMDSFLIEVDRSISKLKRRARLNRNLKFPFSPSYFKKNSNKYISVECLISLLSNKQTRLIEDIDKEKLIKELDSINRKAVEEKQSEDDFEEKPNINRSDEADNVDSEEEGAVENVNLPFDVISSNNKSCVDILELLVPFKIINDILYLDKKVLFELLKINQAGPYYRAYRVIDKILEESNLCLDDAFLYEGRKRSYISVRAFKVLVKNNFLLKPESEDGLIARLDELENQRDSLKTNRILNLKSFDPINFKSVKNTVYINTLQLMRAVGFCLAYVDNNPSKAYFVISKLLSQRGINVSSCFFKQGKSKYVYISLHAVILLFQTELNPFKQKAKLLEEINESLKEQGFILEKRKENILSSKQVISFGKDFPSLKFRVRKGTVYVHRKTLFEYLGLEKAIMSCAKGYEPINLILKKCELDISTSYIKSRQEKYSYISLEAVLFILDSQDPLTVCLENREKFYSSLLITIQTAVGKYVSSMGAELNLRCGSISHKIFNSRIYLHRHTCYNLSGLYEKATGGSSSEYDIYEYPATPLIERGFNSEDCFLSDGGDAYGYISVDALLVLMNLDGDVTNRSLSSAKALWGDIITAITIEAPKLKIRVKMEEFRKQLINYLLKIYVRHLKSCQSDDQSEEFDDVEIVEKNEDEICRPPSSKKPKINSSISDSSEEDKRKTPELEENIECIKNSFEFEFIKSQILANSQDGVIGDWEIKKVDDEMIKLIINPGYGSTRKVSFINPDVTAILSYEFIMRPQFQFTLFINSQKVPSEFIENIFKRSSQKGILNLLYEFISLRPCFGSFNPELVETVEKELLNFPSNALKSDVSLGSDVIVDKNFIGSSQSGRTYAGTVRSKHCRVLAESRVGDTCIECSNLNKLVINRSVLMSEELRKNILKNGSSSLVGDPKKSPQSCKSGQRSVWKIESTDSHSCRFLCPQIQSFNMSLPQQFVGSQQATTIVTHRVDISSNLEAVVTLNEHKIQKNFEKFGEDKQIGSLLDQVASLRFCLGYPHSELVNGIRFMFSKKHLVHSDIKKIFEYVVIDETFKARMSSIDCELQGTIRIQSCQFIAEEYADICNQCRLLQEPLEFLGM